MFKSVNNDEKQFYLDMINKTIAINQEYYHLNQLQEKIDEKFIDNPKYIVDYAIVEDNSYNVINNRDLTHNNVLLIRILLSDDEFVIKYIIKDLFNTYQKDIIISILYTETKLQRVIKELGGTFRYSQFFLVNNVYN